MILVVEKTCITIGGAATNKSCTFPFIYDGIEYLGCIIGDYGYWCSTKVGMDGTHVDGHWGTCDTDCIPGTNSEFCNGLEL